MQLATHKNAVGVAVGATIGHTICTSVAVIGGSMLASKISQGTVATVGGLLFLGFSISSYFYPPLWLFLWLFTNCLGAGCSWHPSFVVVYLFLSFYVSFNFKKKKLNLFYHLFQSSCCTSMYHVWVIGYSWLKVATTFLCRSWLIYSFFF